MNITEVKVKAYEGSGGLKGFASITFDGCFVVSDLTIREGKNGRFVSMPSKKKQNGEYKDICFPITKEFRQIIQDEVLKQFNISESKSGHEFNQDDGLAF